MSFEKSKEHASEKALEFIDDGMIVGLGSGSTSEIFIKKLGEKVKTENLNLTCVPTSLRSGELAEELGLKVVPAESTGRIDIAVDGADEVDSSLNLIKGGGGAHTNEKKIDYKAEKFIVIVDEGKISGILGEKFALPIEVEKEKIDYVKKILSNYGEVKLRMKENKPFITDNGNYIIDVKMQIHNPEKLEKELNEIDGVVENGIFINKKVDLVIVGSENGVMVLR